MTRPAAAEPPAWDRPIVAWTDRTAERKQRRSRAAATPTVEDAINDWLHMRSFSPTTVRGAREHLESARAAAGASSTAS
jgi:hypothetical protein